MPYHLAMAPCWTNDPLVVCKAKLKALREATSAASDQIFAKQVFGVLLLQNAKLNSVEL